MDSDSDGRASELFDYFKVGCPPPIPYYHGRVAGALKHESLSLEACMLCSRRLFSLCTSAQVLCIQGFLACRKHSDHILLLVEMMQHCAFPCLKAGGARVMSSLRKRFHPSLTEEQCVEVVLGLISDSLDAWRTRQYDYYQRVLNGNPICGFSCSPQWPNNPTLMQTCFAGIL